VMDLIAAIRSVRAEMNINVPLPLIMVRVGDHVWERAQRWSEFIMRMARISDVTRTPMYPPGAVQLVVRGEVVALPLAGDDAGIGARRRETNDTTRRSPNCQRTKRRLVTKRTTCSRFGRRMPTGISSVPS